MLGEDGYDVERVADGAAAVARLAREPLPDVLVSELTLPYVDGAAVARYARSRHSAIPVVFVTNHPDLFIRTTWTPAPAPLVLTKPIDYAAFADVLAHLDTADPRIQST
jgi:CheY-like chemotaxis protein